MAIEIAPSKLIDMVDIIGGIEGAYSAAFPRIFSFGVGPVIAGDILSTWYDNFTINYKICKCFVLNLMWFGCDKWWV